MPPDFPFIFSHPSYAPCVAHRLSLIFLLSCAPLLAAEVPDDFPRFVVPGHEKQMDSLRKLYWLHYQPAGPLIPLWDEWIPMSTLWAGRGSNAVSPRMRQRWAEAFAGRRFNAEGYVHTQQHDGPAHAEGWPFPRWMEAGGVGWHFRGTGIGGYDGPPATQEGWVLEQGKDGQINERGWVMYLEGSKATAKSPSFSINARTSPWLRLNWWAAGLEGANCFVEWTTADHPEYSPERRAYFAPATSPGRFASMPAGAEQALELSKTVAETRTMIPLFRVPGWTGKVTGLRFRFDNAQAACVVFKSIHTASDTRHTINNTGFVRGTHDYFMWTRDIAFLRQQIGRMRTAIHYMMSEFDTRNRKCVYTTWPGHEGRSGVRIGPDGKKTIVPGEGVGGNYWDLLPFGGEDALATMYYYDALLDLARLEEAVIRHPQWCIARGAEAFDPADLRRHAREVKDFSTRRFWNEKTGRFGTRDLEGVLHDYGFTFLNNEAIYYGFATDAQARTIGDWISGRRVVEGDTSTGADIYHWRFGARSTTLRNLGYYFWGWSGPESIPWGYQVQDGGSVLGFSYHDLMARLMVDGPDDAWQRLREVLTWFEETQAAGGYREYYKDPSRGTMQGGNVAGGLGLDREFFESILVPQVVLYGFMGFQPTPEGFRVNPRLPRDWPELRITRIHLHDQLLDVTVKDRLVTVSASLPSAATTPAEAPDVIRVELPPGWSVTNASPGVLRLTGRD
jgi:hypothetical protein